MTVKQIPGDEIQDENVNVEDTVVEMSGNEMKKMVHKLLRDVKKECSSEIKSDVKVDVAPGTSGTRLGESEGNVAVS